MEIIEIGEGAYILSTPEMNFSLFRSNIAIRVDSDNLVYMVKLEAEKEGYKIPVQTHVFLKDIVAGSKSGKNPLATMIEKLKPVVAEKWGAEEAKLLDQIQA